MINRCRNTPVALKVQSRRTPLVNYRPRVLTCTAPSNSAPPKPQMAISSLARSATLRSFPVKNKTSRIFEKICNCLWVPSNTAVYQITVS
ncbi:hypothetical protein Mapa_010197 [Marchantia paleacea]|nr:hypothetical protein Mapa_010197 [Marchantia paleacea]